MQFDSKYINSAYTSNKLYTNTHKLAKARPISALPNAVISVADSFGSARKTTRYILLPRFTPEIEGLSRGLVRDLLTEVGEDYSPHVLNKKVEFWEPKGSTMRHWEFNAVRFTVVVNHMMKKIWITPILTFVEEPLETPEEPLETPEEPLEEPLEEPIVILIPLEEEDLA